MQVPDPALSVADNAATTKGIRIVDVVFVLDGEGLLEYSHVVANPDDVP